MLSCSAKKQVKRSYVTAHQLQQQKKSKKSVHVEKTENIMTRKSPRLTKVQEISQPTVTKAENLITRKSPLLNKVQAFGPPTVTKQTAIAKRKLDLEDPIPQQEVTCASDDIEVILDNLSPYNWSLYFLLTR